MKPSPSNRISLSEVASRAGASQATVSRVMNGSAEVSPELQARVQAVIAELGYKPSRLRGGSRKKADTETIGLLSDMTSSAMLQDDFQHRFLAGVEAQVNRNQGHLMFASCMEDIRANRLPPMVEQRLVNGIILKCSDSSNWSWFQRLADSLPTVLLMHLPRDRSISSVMCDNAGGIYQTLRYLRELGHRRIGFLSIRDVDGSGYRSNLHNSQRLEAFRSCATDFGLPLGEMIQDPERDWAQASLEQVIGQALDRWIALGAERPTAVVCAADSYASALMQEAERRGLRLPEDLSITGFMNTVECEHLRPALTSVSLSGEEMGRAAVELLDQRIKFPTSPARHLVVASRLIERLSCTKI